MDWTQAFTMKGDSGGAHQQRARDEPTDGKIPKQGCNGTNLMTRPNKSDCGVFDDFKADDNGTRHPNQCNSTLDNASESINQSVKHRKIH